MLVVPNLFFKNQNELFSKSKKLVNNVIYDGEFMYHVYDRYENDKLIL